jgi:hypothetical protein
MFKKKSLTATSLGLRIVVGGYILYLAYSLIPTIQNAPDLKELIFFIIVVTLFTCAGVGFIAFSLKALIKGEYDKGNTSKADEADTESDNEIEQEDTTDTEEK